MIKIRLILALISITLISNCLVLGQNRQPSTRSTIVSKIANNRTIVDIKYHALLIYVQDYDDNSLDLGYPASDAENIRNVLINKYTFSKDNVRILANPDRVRLLDALQEYGQKMGEQDSLLIFYAGHGYWDENIRQGYWFPANARRGSRANWISNSDIRDLIKAIKARHTLLIADACFSGSLLRDTGRMSGRDPAIEELTRLPSRRAITSGALTTVPDRSPFVHYLVSRLDSNSDKYLLASTLFDRLQIPVINNSPTRQTPLYGVIPEAEDEGGQYTFVLKGNLAANQTLQEMNAVKYSPVNSVGVRSRTESSNILLEDMNSVTPPDRDSNSPVLNVINESDFEYRPGINRLETGISVLADDKITIKSYGKYALDKWESSTPDGISTNDQRRPLKDCNTGAVYAEIGGTRNCVGASQTFVAKSPGDLILFINTENRQIRSGMIRFNVKQYRYEIN